MPCAKSPLMEVGNPDQVRDCELVGTFTGPVSDRMWGTPYLGNFKNEAMEKAVKNGATHILWRTNIDGIEFRPVLKAYRCPPDSPAFRYNDGNSGSDDE